MHLLGRVVVFAEKLPTLWADGGMRLMLRIAIANGKGGTGKTSTTVHLADALACRGAHVLVIDLDDQANATKFIGGECRAGRPTVGDLLLERAGIADVLTEARNGIHLFPSRRGLEEKSHELLTAYYRQEKLAEGLKAAEATYDVGLFDCPPAVSVLTANAIFAADWLLVPTVLDAAAYDGLDDLLEFARVVRRDPLPSSILISNYDGRNRRVNEAVEPALLENYTILDVRVPTCQAVPQAHSALCAIREVNPQSRAWQAFQELAAQVLALQQETKNAAA